MAEIVESKEEKVKNAEEEYLQRTTEMAEEIHTLETKERHMNSQVGPLKTSIQHMTTTLSTGYLTGEETLKQQTYEEMKEARHQREMQQAAQHQQGQQEQLKEHEEVEKPRTFTAAQREEATLKRRSGTAAGPDRRYVFPAKIVANSLGLYSNQTDGWGFKDTQDYRNLIAQCPAILEAGYNEDQAVAAGQASELARQRPAQTVKTPTTGARTPYPGAKPATPADPKQPLSTRTPTSVPRPTQPANQAATPTPRPPTNLPPTTTEAEQLEKSQKEARMSAPTRTAREMLENPRSAEEEKEYQAAQTAENERTVKARREQRP